MMHVPFAYPHREMENIGSVLRTDTYPPVDFVIPAPLHEFLGTIGRELAERCLYNTVEVIVEARVPQPFRYLTPQGIAILVRPVA